MVKVLEPYGDRQGVSNSIFEWTRLVFLMAVEVRQQGELDTKLKKMCSLAVQ
jgi:hypothetical protein